MLIRKNWSFHNVIPLLYTELRFLKNQKGGLRFFKNGGFQCFSLMIYRFCSNNALYWASFFLLNPYKIYIWNYISAWCGIWKCCLYKENMSLFCSPPNMKKQLCHLNLFLCLIHISIGQYCHRNLVTGRGWKFGKSILMEGWL